MAQTTHFPEFTVSASMRAAACAVAASFHAYQQSCYDLPKTKGAQKIQQLLQSQRERKQAYHLALKFLGAAAIKENPTYDLNAQTQIGVDQSKELEPLLKKYLDKRLNELIQHEIHSNPLIKNTADSHPVMDGPW